MIVIVDARFAQDNPQQRINICPDEHSHCGLGIAVLKDQAVDARRPLRGRRLIDRNHDSNRENGDREHRTRNDVQQPVRRCAIDTLRQFVGDCIFNKLTHTNGSKSHKPHDKHPQPKLSHIVLRISQDGFGKTVKEIGYFFYFQQLAQCAAASTLNRHPIHDKFCRKNTCPYCIDGKLWWKPVRSLHK